MRKRLLRGLALIEDYLSASFLVVLIILTSVAVFMRYVMHQPISWMEEMSIILFVWTAMIGAASVMKDGGHIGIDILVLQLPKGVQKTIRLIVSIITMVVCMVVIYLGTRLALNATEMTPILHIKNTYIYLAVPVGFTLIIVHLISNFIADLRSNQSTMEKGA